MRRWSSIDLPRWVRARGTAKPHPEPTDERPGLAQDAWQTFRESPGECVINILVLIAALVGIVGAFAVIGACMK